MNLNPDKLIQKLMAQVPNMPSMDGIMNGYEFKDGKLKASVEYWIEGGGELDIKSGLVILRTKGETSIHHIMKRRIESNLSLLIKPDNLAFLFFSLNDYFDSNESGIITPNNKETVGFSVKSNTHSMANLPDGTIIGYGLFIPYIPTNNISFINQNVPT
jgi:hypothetical protein